MPGETKFKIPASGQRYILFFLLMFIIFIAVGPYWTYQKIQKLDRQIAKLEQDIEEQKLLKEATTRFKQAVQDLEQDIDKKRNLKPLGVLSGKEEKSVPVAREEVPDGAGQGPETQRGVALDNVLQIETRGLSLIEAADIGNTLRNMAVEVGLNPENIRPDVTSLIGKQGEIAVDARVTGSYRGLWIFLHDVGSHPAFKEFVSMSIREIPETRELNLKVRFYTES